MEMQVNKEYQESKEMLPKRHETQKLVTAPESVYDKYYASGDYRPEYKLNANLQEADIDMIVHAFSGFDVWDVPVGKGDLSMPRRSIFEMRIPTDPEELTHRVDAYKQSDAQEAFLLDQVLKMHKIGILSECDHCRCYCPALAVNKPGAPPGVWRFAHDLRPVNAKTIMDYFGLPDPCDMAYRMAGAYFITGFDFASGYWQIRLHVDDRYKTAFRLRDGRTFMWNVAPMGLNLSGVKFCRFVMTKVVGDLLHVTVEAFSDNVFVFTKVPCLKTHIRHCCEFLERVEKANMVLKATKCHIAAQSLNIVGWVISKEGMQVNPEKLQAIRDYQMPLSRTAVRRLLGMANQYRKQIRGYADIVDPLTKMTRKEHPAKWSLDQVTEGARAAFLKLKEVLQQPPVWQFQKATWDTG